MFVTFPRPMARLLCALSLTLIGAGAQAQAQNSQAPSTVPGLDTYSLPAQPERPTPLQTPEPRIAPLPRPTPTATPPAAVVTPTSLPSPVTVPPPPVREAVRSTPRPTPTPEPQPTATPAAAPTLIATPSPVAPSPSPTPSPVATPVGVATPPPAAPSHATGWWIAAVAFVAILTGGFMYLRRRRPEANAEQEQPLVPPRAAAAPEPCIAPPPPNPPVVTPRPRVEIDLEVKRAGTNLLSAAIEYRVTLRNAGDADARGIALDLRLFGVDPRLEPALAALFDAPLDRPVVARFDLAAGTTAALEGTAMAPREAMPPLPIQGASGDRVLFVPVMTVNLHYGWDGGSGQSAASFVIGVDRGPDAKLGPFRLDGAPRMHDRVRLMPFTVSRST